MFPFLGGVSGGQERLGCEKTDTVVWPVLKTVYSRLLREYMMDTQHILSLWENMYWYTSCTHFTSVMRAYTHIHKRHMSHTCNKTQIITWWTSYVSPLHLIEVKGMYTIYYSTIVDYHLGGWETQGVGHYPEVRPYWGEWTMCLVIRLGRPWDLYGLGCKGSESGTEKHSLNLEWIYHSLNIETNSSLFKLKENFGTQQLLNTRKRHEKNRQVPVSHPKDTPPSSLDWSPRDREGVSSEEEGKY